MKSFSLTNKVFSTVLLVASLALISGSDAAASSDKTTQPNILFILLDDIGKEWVSEYGSESVKTPTIDALANSGMRFDNTYAHPQCTPTRISFLTGQYPYRNGWVNHWDAPRWGHGYYDWQSNPSVARIMQQAGYATAAAGKWQVNDFRLQPEAMTKHGFDQYFMWTGYEADNEPSQERYWNPYIHSKNGSKTYPEKFGEDLFSDFLLDFITTNGEQNKPWFAYYAMNLPHGPYVATPHEPEAKTKYAKFAAMVRYADFILGKMVKGLEDSNQRDNTIIVWTTDNGTASNITGIRDGRKIKGAKLLTTEAGINLPFIVNSPKLVPQGVVSNALVDITDLLPTFAELAGIELPAEVEFDGHSFAQHILGKADDSERSWIMAMGGRNNAQVSELGIENSWNFRDRVFRDKQYKLYVNPTNNRDYEKLVDVVNDPEENINLINSKEPKVQQALAKLSAAAQTMPNKDKDPTYRKIAENTWDVPVTVKSQRWKQ
ncbi:sulfatase-like hydrolase/transferase [Thalassotalea fonticola]|uniref:Sulfatase-like hydrolase/transferase n=1 Tax=Thalassotalea fonticola TaxID=3065649 RepID=A0ABZ0GS01_9GAMM|nr:sulfatase-like hydrolase/transferase [Colwelliaceae bacterium S1-1]